MIPGAHPVGKARSLSYFKNITEKLSEFLSYLVKLRTFLYRPGSAVVGAVDLILTRIPTVFPYVKPFLGPVVPTPLGVNELLSKVLRLVFYQNILDDPHRFLRLDKSSAIFLTTAVQDCSWACL